MARQIIKRRAAVADLLEHFVFIFESNEDAAERFLLSAEETFRLLVSQPQMGRKLESQNAMLAGIRIFPVKNFKKYLIFYKPLRDGIEVVRVLHGARDLRSIFEM
jgi:toxin ParE1/3/4